MKGWYFMQSNLARGYPGIGSYFTVRLARKVVNQGTYVVERRTQSSRPAPTGGVVSPMARLSRRMITGFFVRERKNPMTFAGIYM
jgi:hypothetical protein